MKKILLALLIPGMLFIQSQAQVNQKYERPSQSIIDLVDSEIPAVRFSPDGQYMLILQPAGMESQEQISQPITGVAGLRINGANNTLNPQSFNSFTGIKIKDLKSGQEHVLNGLPDRVLVASFSWSPNGEKIAFINKTLHATELWLADLSNFSAKKLLNQSLNASFGDYLQWHPSGGFLLVQAVNSARGPVPQKPDIAEGPIVQENIGGITPARTFQYLLQNSFDEVMMDYYLTSILLKVDLNGKTTPIYKPSIFKSESFSPDGNYILIQTINRPYSYLVPIYSFSHNTLVLDKDGNPVKELNRAPLADKVPIAYDAVAPGPRSYQWRSDQPSTLVWVEALDEGDSRKEVDFRDAVFSLNAPFTGQPQKIYTCKLRYQDLKWINNDYAIVNEGWRKTRASVMTLINPSNGEVIKEISNRSSEYTYDDPGEFVTNNRPEGKGTLLTDKGKGLSVFTIAEGASPEGDRPFLMRWDLLSGKTDTLFKSKAPYYERPVFFDNTGFIYLSRESQEESPNYYKAQIHKKKRQETALTAFPDLYPSLKEVQKSQISYTRSDGVKLTGTLYLPGGYKKENGRLPVFVWAYPREFKTIKAAAQVKGSPYRFPIIRWSSPVFMVTQGFAVVDNADMPIVGAGREEPNNTFVQQISDNAGSLINYLVDMGIADRERIGVGGHSYGAFMTANLLAHTDLFAAGIARSGAYNRTLTPFGFQNEARTFWQAPEIYGAMSPFFHADKIKTPLLLIHGAADENSGTFPVQSERLYSAVKGHGGTIRLVMLPGEFHAYRGRTSILHMLWEQEQWLNKYVKNKKKQ